MSVLCIGSAVIDITACPVEASVTWKEKQRISDIRILPGGDAVNQSVRLAALGVDVALCGCVGDDQNGQLLADALRNRSVDTRFLRRKTDFQTTASLILVNGVGERHTFSVKGAHSTLAKEDLPDEFPADCQAISLASLFSMTSLEQDCLEGYLKQAKKNGILVFADLASDKLGQGLPGIRSFLPYIDYFLPSLYDALPMTGTNDAESAAKVYHDLGARHVIIKCGEKGCFCLDDAFSGWIPAIPVKPVDTTGAGDCMVAVFLARILAGDHFADACRYACAAASYSTLFMGASQVELSDRKIREFIETQTLRTP
ncbi:MAG: carbohydrate kinase family protein [Lachnospiraceae bacterium]|nr:carbohydrate kinase family protein [Lachnospiraceae bacterium]